MVYFKVGCLPYSDHQPINVTLKRHERLKRITDTFTNLLPKFLLNKQDELYYKARLQTLTKEHFSEGNPSKEVLVSSFYTEYKKKILQILPSLIRDKAGLP